MDRRRTGLHVDGMQCFFGVTFGDTAEQADSLLEIRHEKEGGDRTLTASFPKKVKDYCRSGPPSVHPEAL